MRARRPAAAFTLIELLVVIAIMGIIMTILLPSLAGARRSARQVKCLSNQKQIGTALVGYANTYQEWTPRESGISEGLTRFTPLVPAWQRSRTNRASVNISWAFNLRPFLDDRVDPSRGDQGLGDRYVDAPYYKDPARLDDPHQIHYVNNGLKFRKFGPNVRTTTVGKPPTRMTRYKWADRVMYLTCFTDDPAGFRWGNNYAPGNDELQISIFYDLWNPSSVTGLGPDTPTEAQRVAPRRHTNGANVVYLDGHAALVPGRDLTNPKNWDDGDYLDVFN
ncbi:MAG: prepilin-type N-terminal cleavage/methylation domain-containing protein [Phycisphaerales bacterium]|nr:prepilin-type N-terminal cleavage/methylation domain-containing protein [Phycisphaerales bacterium]